MRFPASSHGTFFEEQKLDSCKMKICKGLLADSRDIIFLLVSHALQFQPR